MGDPPYPPMQCAAKARGIDLGGLRARQFTVEDFDRFDLIVAMDRQNLADIELLRPKDHPALARMMAAQDVPDPYYTRDFKGCLDIIEAASARLLIDMTGSPVR